MLFSAIFSLLILLPLSINGQSASVWSCGQTPQWPVVFTATPNNVPSTAVYTWTFPTAPNPSCTSNGQMNVSPCTGRVVDHVFPQPGAHTAILTITDPSLSSPLVVTTSVTISPNTVNAQRQEVLSMSDGDWNSFQQGLYFLKNNGVYDHMARIHAAAFTNGVVPGSNTSRSAAHCGPAFLVWHRASLRIAETCIQTAIGDPTFGMPYWDWRSTNVTTLMTDKYFGPSGNPNNDHVVESGPFCNNPNAAASPSCPKKWVLPDDFPDPVKAIKRNVGQDSLFKMPTSDQISKLLTVPNYDLPPFSEAPTAGSFRNALEGWYAQSGDSSFGLNHNGVHRWLGGTMAQVVDSFQDPLFLIHHAFVDYLYTQWQQSHGCADGTANAICYRPGTTDPGVTGALSGAVPITSNGVTFYSILGHMYDDSMFPWGLRPHDLLAANQGYSYLSIGQQKSQSSSPPPSSPASSPPPSSPSSSPASSPASSPSSSPASSPASSSPSSSPSSSASSSASSSNNSNGIPPLIISPSGSTNNNPAGSTSPPLIVLGGHNPSQSGSGPLIIVSNGKQNSTLNGTSPADSTNSLDSRNQNTSNSSNRSLPQKSSGFSIFGTRLQSSLSIELALILLAFIIRF